MIDPASGLVTAVVSLVKFLGETDRPARYRIKGSGMEFGTSAELYAELARRREAATAEPEATPADPAAGPEEPAPPEPIPSPQPPTSPEPPTPAEPETPPQTPRESLGAGFPPLPTPRVQREPPRRLRRTSAGQESAFPSHILSARRPVDFPRPRSVHIPRGSKKYPSGFEEIQGRVDRAIGRAIERALKRRREAPEPFRPKGRTPSGGWSWETYRRDVERVIKDSARRRGAPDPTRRRDTPVRTKREPIRHPFPPPVLGPQEAEQIEREVFEGIPEPVMPPLPRTAESRGFGDIKHSFPRPAPEPLPPMEPKIELPPVEVAAPPPISSPGPVQTPVPMPNPLGIPTPGLLAAAGVFAIAAARSQTRTRSRTRPRSQTATPTATSSPPVTSSPPATATPIPTPAPSSPPSSPPPPTLTSSTATGASSRCPTPSEQRKQDKRKREQKRKECRQFLSVRVPAHKRKMCVSDLTKYLFRKLQRTARAALRKKIIAELEERGVPASRLIKATKRPRRKKAEVEVGGVEIDFEDLLGEK